jgi:hypothetical protein
MLMPILLSCRQNLTPKIAEEKVMLPLVRKMHSHCIGRYLIDLPGELRIKGAISVSGVRITSAEMDFRQFNANLLLRGERLKRTESFDEHPFFYKEGNGQSEHTRYFISRRHPGSDPGARQIEAYKWDRGYEIKLEITGSDYTDPDQTNDSLVKQMTEINDVPRKTGIVLDLLNRVRSRPEDEIPSEPGVCFFGGFIVGKSGETENVWATYRPLKNPDALFTVNTDTDIKQETTLLQRSGNMQSALAHFTAKTLRKGVVDLPNLPAEEWLMRARTLAGVPGQYLTLEANSSSGKPRAPLVILDLETGLAETIDENPPHNSSLSDDDVLTVWDAVSRSLRARPNGF